VPHMVNLLDAGSVLSAYGWVGIGVILFAETGLLIGFFLPGDTLLFTAGLLCTSAGASAHTKLSLPLVLLAAVFGALAGAQTGHFLGQRGGRALLARSKSKQLHKGIARAEEILAKYGHAKAIVIARFIPVVRTVLNPLAGAVGVPTRTFAIWQIAGGTLWSAGLVIGGYVLGNSIPNVDKYLLPIVAVIFIVSVVPVGLEILRSRKDKTATGADPSTPQPYGPNQAYGPNQQYPTGPQRQGGQPYAGVPQQRDAYYPAGQPGGAPAPQQYSAPPPQPSRGPQSGQPGYAAPARDVTMRQVPPQRGRHQADPGQGGRS
jgi:membrane-associated protein